MFHQQAVENVFLKDVMALRRQAEAVMDDGAAPVAETAVALLQSVLAAEIVCVLRYTAISVSRDGLENSWIGAEFQEQANDERRHMNMAAARIRQLGGVPEYVPAGLESRAGAVGVRDFTAILAENLAAERCVIEHYRNLIGYLGTRDAASRALLEDIVRDEEDHTSDMQDLLGACGG